MIEGVIAALGSAIEEIVAGRDDVERVADGEAVELRRSGRPFVRIEPAGISFLVGEGIAAAARRTPGVSASASGPAWAAFHPASLDRFALDRATSWTELAWRRATD